MLTWEMLVEAQALRAQGWSISAIARHLDVTRLTVRRYLSGERVPGQRARTMVDPFEEVAEYCRLRLAADPHVWASTLFDEVVELGYAASYQSFTRALRTRELRPRCPPPTGSTWAQPTPPQSSAQPEPTAVPTSAQPSAKPALPGTALAVLASVPVRGRAPKTGYVRNQFGQAWSDDVNVPGGHNGCDTRNDILRRDLTDITLKPNTAGCVVATGKLADP
jgi:hypothetical protein